MNETAPPRRRRPMHRRAVICESFLRDDGLWEVEARLTDTKPYAHDTPSRGTIAVGEPVHDMTVRLAVDDAMVIREAELSMQARPFATCPAVEPRFNRLVGLGIGPGWRRRVQEVLPRLETCTHAMELLAPAVTTLYQTLAHGTSPDGRDTLVEQRHAARPPFFLNGCHSWRTDGPVVAELFPQFAADATK